MKSILITGGGGFLGKHLIRRLLVKYQDIEVRAFSRSENEIQEVIVQSNSKRLMPIIGDIRDDSSVKYAIKDVDTVVHLAAMKHIDFCEMYPLEAIATNVAGTKNLLDSFDGTTFIGMSTDKAVEATTCYGATKLLLEKLVLDQASKEKTKRHMVVRSGNIFGSSGSVIERWKEQISKRNEISITNPDMTRFFITVAELVDFIIEVMEKGENGKVYVPYQKSILLADLVKAIIELYGNEATGLDIIGGRAGEKEHELLFTGAEGIVTSLDSNSSRDAVRLSLGEIKDWLTELDKLYRPLPMNE